jgi:hypothetical protein
MHVPKTGGTTLRLLLEMQLSEDELYPYRNCATAKYPITEKLASGHLPYWLCQNLDPHFQEAFKVTILRDPLERYLSFLRAKKKADKTLPDLESVIRLRKKPYNKYKEGLIDNALCRYLSKDPSFEGNTLFESAKQSLHEMDAVLFFEHFADDVMTLFNRLGIELAPDQIPKINVTEKEPVSDALIEEVKKLNYWDMQLYAYAKEFLPKKNTPYLLRTTAFDFLLQTMSYVDYTFNLPLNGTGWSYRDREGNESAEHPTYRWVMSNPADIFFSLEEGSDYTLLFYAWALSEEIVPKVKVNGADLEIIRLDKCSKDAREMRQGNGKFQLEAGISTDRFSCYKGKIPKEWLDKQPTKITFYGSKTVQYRDIYPKLYNRNHPPLSFAVNRIQIVSEKYPYFSK